MSDADKTIDWSKTTFEGSRREQLRRWAALSVRERLEALDRLSEQASRLADKTAAAAASGLRDEPAGYRPTTDRNEIVLSGCAPAPLAAYLKGLAVLRLVAEQAGDPDVTGCWRNDVFVLQTRLTRDELIEFFLQRYEPTPLVAPWGARSGFYSSSSEKTAREALNQIAESKSKRLQSFRESIVETRALLEQYGFDEKASDEKKLELLHLCRSHLPDHLLPWLDACYVLTEDGRKFPPLLGTGGNEGSGSYVSGFAQQVAACLIERSYDDALEASLFGTPALSAASGQTPGHFSPTDAGGANMSSGFEGETQTNPWDYLLALEGTLLFASAATRRNETASASFNFPFVASPISSGASAYGQQEERPKKAKRQVMEIWLPLWSSPCSLAELSALFSEGRATLKRRVAKDGLDFARAVARLGVDRGITQFQRYSFLMRNGQSFFATPIERFVVRRNAHANLIDELDDQGWLARLQHHARNDRAPAAFRTLAALLDAALFALTQRAERQAVERVLRLLGRIEATAAVSTSVREAIGPVPTLSLGWASESDDGSVEFRIALALASLSMSSAEDGKPVTIGLRLHLAPVSLSGWEWDTQSRLACWGQGGIERNLAELLHRRRIAAIGMGAEGELLHSRTGAALDDVHRFLSGDTDDRRIAELMHGLACVNLEGWRSRHDPQPAALPAAYSLLKPFFTAESLLKAIGWLLPDRSLRLPAEIPARLAADDVNTALRHAWQRLHVIGCKLPGRDPPRVPRDGSGPRLLAALTIPLTLTETRRLLKDLDLEVEADTEFAANAAD